MAGSRRVSTPLLKKRASLTVPDSLVVGIIFVHPIWSAGRAFHTAIVAFLRATSPFFSPRANKGPIKSEPPAHYFRIDNSLPSDIATTFTDNLSDLSNVR
jgi:hypothetical protein